MSSPQKSKSVGGSSASDAAVLRSTRRKDLFGDCALIEIIHLHECLRGALKALEQDVNKLCETIKSGESTQKSTELQLRVAGRFKVIWSVFRAHSSAEDEFIWPTLQSKTQGKVCGSPKYDPTNNEECDRQQQKQQHHQQQQQQVIGKEEYEEDHADEERMFSMMDGLLTQLRNRLLEERQKLVSAAVAAEVPDNPKSDSLKDTIQEVHDLTKTLSQHLRKHLDKEENECMPLVAKHLTKAEIQDLVGKIMGKRSSDMIAQIMTMAVQNLNKADREEMVKYMKQASAGTFFDRWLTMSGWMSTTNATVAAITVTSETTSEGSSKPEDKKRAAMAKVASYDNDKVINKRPKTTDEVVAKNASTGSVVASISSNAVNSRLSITSQAELEKLIRTVAANPNLNSMQKTTTIQGLRDSVWKNNQRIKQQQINQITTAPLSASHATSYQAPATSSSAQGFAAASATCTPPRRVTPPAMYFKKMPDGKIEMLWNSQNSSCVDEQVPGFSPAELAPTYHDGATANVLGCPHYARACKLRHPVSGRLYTCRLCCEQEREMSTKGEIEPLDRYSVSEVMCMKCNTLQPAEDCCLNSDCESRGKPYAKYFCRICHLYDDRPRPIFHCPYCNTCRMGLGLGIDYWHCMRCNACVSISDEEHRCIPQKLQGSCPICHESLFQSTQPLRGLKCGHVMHLSCFTMYRRDQRYSCPLCMKSMEDMTDYFSLLDAAIRMQPMPLNFSHCFCDIYCQDCEKTGRCTYHFVGLKCPHCGSYNTREMNRVQGYT